MRSSTRYTIRIARALPIAMWLCAGALGCSNEKSTTKPEAQHTHGGDNALDRAGRNIDDAHRQFKQDVKPTARVVDEKANEAVGEGKKAVNKVVDAMDGSSTSATPSKDKSKDKEGSNPNP